MSKTREIVMALPRGKKTKTIHIRLDEDVCKIIDKRAAHERRDSTEYARYLILTALFGIVATDRIMERDGND